MHANAVERVKTSVMALVIAVSALARFYHLRYSPGWYHDETIFLGQAWNLIHGRFQWDAVTHTFLPHLPLYHFLLGSLLVIFGKDIIFVRLLAAVCGIVITWMIYKIGRQSGNTNAGIIGAILFAVCPYTLLLTRMGFTYSLAALLGAINLYFLLRHLYSSKPGRSLFYASIAAGLGMLVTPLMASRFIATLVVALLTVPLIRTVKMAVTILTPLFIYVLCMLLFQRTIFLEEVSVILGNRLQAPMASNALGTFFNALRGYGYLGIVGFFFLPIRDQKDTGSVRRLLAFVFFVDLLMPLKIGDDSSFYRMGIIFTPILFVCLGCLLDEIRKRALEWIRSDMTWVVERFAPNRRDQFRLVAAQKTGIILFGVAALLFLAVIFNRAREEIEYRFPSMYKHFQITTVHNTFAAQRTAEWLRPLLKPNDLVITTHLEWMLNCRTASPMLVMLAEGGKDSEVYFEGLKKRFLYPCRLKNARFAILHEASRRIASAHGSVWILSKIKEEWTLVHSDETIRVYANPDWEKS